MTSPPDEGDGRGSGPGATARSGLDAATVLGLLAFGVASVQYFVAQVVVAAAWVDPVYRWNDNYISDLGNTECGPFSQGGQTVYVCSPLHAVMNVSFVVSGVLLVTGAVLLRRWWPRNRFTGAGSVLLVLAGLQKLFIGFYPENTVPALHAVGALNLLTADLAILLVGLGIARVRGRRPGLRPHRFAVPGLTTLSIATAAVGLVAPLAAPLSEATGVPLLGLGIGGAERLAAYPSNLWTLAVGLLTVLRAGNRSRG